MRCFTPAIQLSSAGHTSLFPVEPARPAILLQHVLIIQREKHGEKVLNMHPENQ